MHRARQDLSNPAFQTDTLWQSPGQEATHVQAPLIFDFRNKTVSVGGGEAARKALAEVVAAQRAAVVKSNSIRATVTKS